MSTSEEAVAASCPYPGLRPFYREESDFFFGREEHIEELLAKLESNRFVAVIGASGCGKSSLVRAGLLPMLENGFMAEAGPHWRMATLRPGNAPFEHLTQALLEECALGPERSETPQAKAMLEATLRRGRLGLVDAMRETLLPEGTNLLVLVDQFEEIFRYREQSSVNEADAFVDLILAAAQHRREPRQTRRDAPVYVLLTMRSDFIGDCALFLGLPEAINASQFLTPRLNRDQCRAAIVGPARAMGGEVESPLVNHLLNNLRADADHLPLLQHVLMRMWRTTVARNPGVAPTLGLADLETTGGMDQALSSHADEAYEQLSPKQQRIAEFMLRSLCEMGADGRAIRRLVRLDEVASIAETNCDDVFPIVEIFRHPDRSFLMPPTGVPLKEDTVLDISHESLIRQWKRLADWTADEAASARTYRRLRQTAHLWERGEAALWRTPDLEIVENWRDTQKPNPAWSSRYGGDFDITAKFLDASIAARSKRQRARVWRIAGAFAAVAIVAVLMGVAALREGKARTEAENQSKIAQTQTALAEQQRQIAEGQSQKAEDQRRLAEKEAHRANRSSYNAAFTGILDEWRLAGDQSEFQKHLDSFSEKFREFTWYLCQSLAARNELEPQVRTTRHGAVNTVAYLWDDDQLLSGADDGTVQAWNLAHDHADGAMLWKHPAGGPVLAMSVSPATRLVALAGDDGRVVIFDIKSRRVLRSLDHTGARVRSLAFSPDGEYLATAGDDPNIILWRMPSAEQVATFPGHTHWVSSIAFSPDGRFLASGSYDTTIRVLDVNGGSNPTILRGHTAPVLSIAYAPDGKRLVSGGEDRVIKLWDIPAVKCRGTVEGHAAAVNAVAFSPGGERLVSGDGEGTLRMWTIDGFALKEWVAPQRRHAGAVNMIAFSPTGKQFATASSDSKILLWDADFGLRLDSERAECQIPTTKQLAFASDATLFATVASGGTVAIWKKGTSGQFASNDADTQRFADITNATAAIIQQDTKLLAIGKKDGSVELRDLSGRSFAPPEKSHDSAITTLVFDPSGQYLASADERGAIRLWQIEEMSIRRLLDWKRHSAPVRSLAFSPQKAGTRILASASEDGTVRVWNLEAILADNEPSQSIAQHEIAFDDHEDWVGDVAFSPTMPILASASDDGTIRVWEWPTWELTTKPKRTRRLTGHFGAVTALAFSSDGETLASGGVDRMIRLWDPQEGHLRLSLAGHLAPVRAVAFLPAGTASRPSALASLSDDGILKFWIAGPTRTALAAKIRP